MDSFWVSAIGPRPESSPRQHNFVTEHIEEQIKDSGISEVGKNIGNNPGTVTHRTKKSDTEKRVSINSQKQKMDYLVPQRKGTAVSMPI